jgi:hypothetical protein
MNGWEDRSLFNPLKYGISYTCTICLKTSNGSSLGKATGYGIDDGRIGVRAPVESGIVTSAYRPGRFWGPHSLLSNGRQVLFPGAKVAGA